LERSAEGAKQGESSDSTERVGEHMFGEQVFGEQVFVFYTGQGFKGVTYFTKVRLDKGN
jgi:hypothetical protein